MVCYGVWMVDIKVSEKSQMFEDLGGPKECMGKVLVRSHAYLLIIKVTAL